MTGNGQKLTYYQQCYKDQEIIMKIIKIKEKNIKELGFII